MGRLFVPVLIFHFLVYCLPAFALPQLENIESGSAAFNQIDASTLNITADDNAVINFQSFDIASNETVNFIQPSNNSNVLNRVTGSLRSEILGGLFANGNLFLVNPNGIHFGATAQVRANTLIASALNISTDDFVHGNYNFQRDSNNAFVQNEGTITANNVALLGGAVNNSGVIQGRFGVVHLASGDKMAVTIDRGGLIAVEVTEQTTGQIVDANGNPIKDAITNSGTIEGGQVFMTARTAADVFKNAVNQTGTVRATAMVERNGVIEIVGDDDIELAGTLDAQGTDSNPGEVKVASTEGSVTVVAKLETTGNTTISAAQDINVNADITSHSGNLQLLSDADLNGAGSFNQAKGTTIATLESGDITIQASGKSMLDNIIAAGDLILKDAGAPAEFKHWQDSTVKTIGSLILEKQVTLLSVNTRFEVGKDWIARGTFMPEKSTVTLVSSKAAFIVGANTFNNLEVIVPGKTVHFDSDNTQTIVGSLVLKGQYGNLIYLTSIDPSKQARINPQGQTDIQYALINNIHNIRGPPLKAQHTSSLGLNTNFDLDPFWTGSGLSSNWSDRDNWDTGTVPTAFDTVTFDGVFAASSNKDSIVDSGFAGTVANLALDGYRGTLTLARDLSVTGNITLNSGTMTTTTPGVEEVIITLGGNWINVGGTFLPGTSTVLFTDASQVSQILGSNTFYNFTSVTPNKIIQFKAGQTQTISGLWKIQGAYAEHVRLVSTEPGVQWKVNPSGPRDLTFSWVEDSHNIHPDKMILTESTNRGNSINWDPTGTWTGASSNAWGTGGNWSGLGGAAPGSGDDLVFPSGASNLSTSNNIAAATSFNSITISGSGYTLAGNSITLAGAITDSTVAGSSTISLNIATTAVRTITVDNAGETLIISGVVSGAAGGFNKAGAGVLTVSGTNTFTGGVTLSAGTLNINAAAALGTTAGTFTIAGGTIDNTSGGSITTSNYPHTWSGDYTFTGTGDLNFGTGAKALSANRQVTVSAGTLTVGGVVSGAFSLTKAGAGAITVNGTNTFTGGFTLSAGTLNIGAAAALGTTAGTFTITGGTIDNLTGFSITTSNYPQAWNGDFTFTGSSALNLGTGAVTLSANRQVTISASRLTVGGVISGAFGLTKTGAGILALSGTNTFTGGVNLNAGTLDINAAAALGTTAGTLTISSGTTINNNSGGTVTTSNYPQTWNGDFTFTGTNQMSLGTGAVSLGANVQVTASASTFVVDGVISGGFSLTKAGAGTMTLAGANTFSGGLTMNAGTLTLSGANTYTGGTTLTAGTLNVNNATALGNSSSTFTITSGSTFNNSSGGTITLSNNNPMVWNGDFTFTGGSALIMGTGTVSLGADVQISAPANTLSIGGVISGAHSLTKASAGTITLSGANTFTGGVTLSAGRININNASALGTTAGTFTIAGGTIDNSSGGAITTLDYPQAWNADFTFNGSDSINFGTGPVSLGANTQVTVSSHGLTIGGVISGAFKLTKAGAGGTLTLSGANTFTGGTTLSSGPLNINNPSALGTTAGTFTIAGGTINNTTGALMTTLNYPMAWNGSFTFTGTSNLSLGTGAVTLGASPTITTTAGNLTVGGVISGAFALTKAGGAGSLTLSAANTFTGGTTLTLGTLNINNAAALGTTAGTFTISGGTIDNTSGSAITLNNYPQSWGGNFTFTGTNDLDMGTGNVALSANRTVTVTNFGKNLTVGGVISGAFSLGTTGSASGTLTLSGANTFTGGFNHVLGTLNINNASALGSTAGTFNISSSGSGTTIDNTSGAPITLNNYPQSWTGIIVFTGTNDLNLGAGAVTPSASRILRINGGTLTVSGAIGGGAISLTKQGAGTLLLTGLSTFTGGLVATGGTLLLDLATNTTGVVDATNTLTMGGGALTVKGAGAGSSSQTLGNPTFTGSIGPNTITLDANGGTGTSLTLGNTWTAGSSTGVYIDISSAGTGTLTSSPALTNGLIAGYPVIKDATSIGFATVSGGNVVRYTGASALLAASSSATTNFSLSGSLTMTNAAHATNTLLIDTSGGSGTLDIAGAANVLSFTGVALLVIGNNDYTIQNGQVGANATALTVHHFGTGNLTISGTISNNGAGSLAKDGPGTVTLPTANAYTAGTRTYAGTLNINNATAIGTGAFNIYGGTIDNTSGGSITLTNNNVLTWGNNFTFAGTSSLNMGTGAVALTTNNTFVQVTVSNNTLTAGGVLSGGINIIKAGAGALTLSGTNTHTGGMTLNAGTLNINAAAALGTTAGTFTINGGTIDNTSGGSITMSNYPMAWNSDFTFTGSNALNMGTGAVTANANRTITASASTLTVGGIISGPNRSFTKAGAGTLTLSGVNTYTGTTTISAGTVSIAADTGVGADPGWGGTVADRLTINGGTLATSASFTMSTYRGITLGASNGTIDVAAGTTLAYGGVIAGVGTLTKISTGQLTLSGINTYTGVTTISSGTISIAADSGLGTAPGGATAGHLTFGGGTLATTASFTLNSNRGIAMTGAGTLDVAASTTLPYGGIIAGSGLLTKSSTGMLTLSGANTNTGGVTLSAGTLNINHATALGGSAGTFTISGGTIDNTSGGTITMTANNPQAWNSDFTFTGTGALNLGTGAVTLSANRQVTTSASTLAVGGIIGGAFSLTKAGAGTMTLSGANTFTGGTTLSAGTLNINNATALGGSAGTFTISGGTIDNNSGGSITISANNPHTWNADFTFTGSNALNFGTGAVTLGASRQVTVSASTLTVGGAIGGAFSLTKAGAGTMTLSGANTFTGGTTLSAGTLNINNASALGTIAGTFTITSGTIDNTSGGLITTVNYPQAWNGDFTFTGTNALNLGTGAVTLSANRQVTTSASTLTVGGVIGGTFSLTKAGAGTMTLSGANTFTGGTTLSAGTLNINNASALGTTAGTFTISGGTIDNTSGGSITTSNYTQAWNGDFTFTGTNALNLGIGAVTLSANRQVTSSASTLTVGGVIGGAFTFTKAGAGAMTLSGVNTYSGATTINAGTLSIAADSGLGTAPGGATPGHLTFGGGTLATTASFTLNSNRGIALTGAGTLDVAAGTTLPYGGIIAGAGLLTKTSTGTLTLSGTNTNTGGVTLSTGTLNINAAAALGTTAGTFTISGGTIDNTSGGSITTSNYPQAWNGDFTFTGTNALNLGTGAVTLSANRQVTTSASTLTVGGIIGGAFTMTKAGTGTMTFTGANTYSGATTINAGVLNIQNNTALGSGTVNVTVASSAALQLQGGITVPSSKSLILNGAGVSTDGALRSISGNNTVAGTITSGSATRIASDAGTLTLTGAMDNGGFAQTFSGAGDIDFSGAVSNDNGITKTGAGTLKRITNALTLAGAFTVSAGTFNANGQTAAITGLTTVNGGTYLASTAAQTLTGGLTVSSGTFNAGSATINVPGDINLTGGTLTAGTSTFAINGAATQTITSGGNTFNAITITNASVGGTTFADRLQTATLTNITDASTIKFAAASAGAPHTITTTLTLTGGASKITLAPMTAATTWFISPPAGTTVTGVIVSYSTSDKTITPLLSTNGGNNVLWAFSTGGAQTNTWTGTVSGDWNTAGNWSASQTPSSTDTVVIEAAGNTPSLSGTATIGELILNGPFNAGSSIIIVLGNVTAGPGGSLSGVSPNISAGGYVGTLANPIPITISGLIELAPVNMQNNVSVVITGSGQVSFGKSIPGFVVNNNHFIESVGQASFRGMLKQAESTMLKWGTALIFLNNAFSNQYRTISNYKKINAVPSTFNIRRNGAAPNFFLPTIFASSKNLNRALPPIQFRLANPGYL